MKQPFPNVIGIDELITSYTSKKQIITGLSFRNPKLSTDKVEKIIVELEKKRIIEKVLVTYYVSCNHGWIPKSDVHYCFNPKFLKTIKTKIEIIDDKVNFLSTLKSSGGLMVVNALENNGSMTPKTISRVTHKTKSCIGNILKSLRTHGIVTCRYNEKNENCERYWLTDYARQALGVMMKTSKIKAKIAKNKIKKK